MLHATYRRELNRSYLVLNNEIPNLPERYSYRMVAKNKIRSLLPCQERSVDGESFLYYDISSRQPLERLYEGRQMQAADIRQVLEALSAALSDLEEYLLGGESILLDPAMIFADVETEELFFCFYPTATADGILQEGAQNQQGASLFDGGKGGEGKSRGEGLGQCAYLPLADFFLEHIDHGQEAAVNLAYQFYKMCKSSHFVLSGFMPYLERETRQGAGRMRDTGVSDRVRPNMAGRATEDGRLMRDGRATEDGRLMRDGRAMEDSCLMGDGRAMEDGHLVGNGRAYNAPSRDRFPGGALSEAPFGGSAFAGAGPADSAFPEGEFSESAFADFPLEEGRYLGAAANGFGQEDGRPFPGRGSRGDARQNVPAGGRRTKKKKKSKEAKASGGKRQAPGGFLGGLFRRKFVPSGAMDRAEAACGEPPSLWDAYADRMGKMDAGETVYFSDLEKPRERPRGEPWLTEIGGKRRFRLEPLPVVVGKLPDRAEVVLEDASVSRVHARFFLQNEELWIMDLNSRNGTAVNGNRLAPNQAVELSPGDELFFGRERFTLSFIDRVG